MFEVDGGYTRPEDCACLKEPEISWTVIKWSAIIICLVLTGVFLRNTRFIKVRGESMVPTFNSGDMIVMRTAINEETLREEQYPVCWIRLDDGHNIIKRLIGYPNDRVDLIDGATYVNGVKIMDTVYGSWDNQRFDLGPSDYLFLGDNRENSNDGRFWQQPFVGIENIKGFAKGSGLELTRK